MNRRRGDLQNFDIEAWPAFDFHALAPAAQAEFERRRRAVTLYARGEAVQAIERQTGIHVRQLYRLLDGCLAQNEDGMVFGFRGLLKHRRVGGYQGVFGPNRRKYALTIIR